MSESREYIKRERENGSVQISEDVITAIVANTVKEVEGVYGLAGNLGGDIAALLGQKNNSGIKLVLGEASVAVECDIIVRFNSKIVDVAKNVQEAVASAILDMTDVPVDLVNVNVVGVAIPKSAKKAE